MKNPPLKLKDWNNKDKVGTRFPPSTQICPRCKQPVLRDTWPPDSTGGGMGTCKPDGSSHYEGSGSAKFVCLSCKIAFKVSYTDVTERKTVVSGPVDLVEKDGYLLTPYDVWREKVKEETGQYPQGTYI